jgi:hypothetical protein
MKQILSFGAGIQSTCLLLMSCKGLLPKLDAAVFADVGWEPKEVYDHLDWCKEYAAGFGIDVAVVKQPGEGLRDAVLNNITKPDGGRFSSLPFFTATIEGERQGMSMRQCTFNYKIAPITKYLRESIMGLKPRQRAPKEVMIEQWMGISFDEATRAKPSQNVWCKNVFPLISYGCKYLDGKNWRRRDCINWLQENYPERNIPRSACIGCPFHSTTEWRRIRENKEEWENACEFDDKIRIDKRGKIKSRLYLHSSCVPLRDADLRTSAEKGQPDLWDNECEGMCGL